MTTDDLRERRKGLIYLDDYYDRLIDDAIAALTERDQRIAELEHAWEVQAKRITDQEEEIDRAEADAERLAEAVSRVTHHLRLVLAGKSARNTDEALAEVVNAIAAHRNVNANERRHEDMSTRGDIEEDV